MSRLLALLIPLLALLNACVHDSLVDTSTPVDPDDPPVVDSTGCDPNTTYFVNDVLPILSSSCAMSGCHDAATAQDGVVLTDYGQITATADVRPGDADGSDLYEVLVESDPSKKMPPPSSGITLTGGQIQTVRDWIQSGAQNTECEDAGACDTLNRSYANHISPILDTHCRGCHGGASPQGGIDLTTYADVKARVNDGSFFGSLTGQPGWTPMPFGQPPLDDCLIDQIESWIHDGAPDN